MYMKAALENQPNLSVRQAEIVSIDTDGAGEITSVTTAMGGVYSVRAVILATGTFLKGKIFVGEYSEESGPDGMHPAAHLSDSCGPWAFTPPVQNRHPPPRPRQ